MILFLRKVRIFVKSPLSKSLLKINWFYEFEHLAINVYKKEKEKYMEQKEKEKKKNNGEGGGEEEE